MALRDPFLTEFDQEMRTTRTVLAAIPDAKAGYRPHPKGWRLSDLALHLVNVQDWMLWVLTQDVFDFGAADNPPPRVFTSTAALLEVFDRGITTARAALAAASDARLLAPWTLQIQGKVHLTLPRTDCLRSFVFNHHYHHRGQLTVFLRLCDCRVPPVYGPTGDV